MESLVILFVLIVLGYTVGSYRERAHYRSIEKREQLLQHIPVVSGRHYLEPERVVSKVRMVSGSVVIGQDYFKKFMANLRNFFGGRLSTYETLLDRGRREAILRMKESATSPDLIINTRIETSTIGFSANRKTAGYIEVLAYGTAIEYQ